MNKIIKTEEEYDAAIQRLHSLLDLSPEPGSREGDEIELLTLLLGNYEERTVEPFQAVSAVEAIRFRMEQLDLRQQDLVPYLGAASRVSEVLSGKRSLTVPMIRALHERLGIPIKALLGTEEQIEDHTAGALDTRRFPIREMKRRGWIESEEQLGAFLAPVITSLGTGQATGLFRRSTHLRARSNSDFCALIAWSARVVAQAQDQLPRSLSELPQLDWAMVRDIARFSVLDTGPKVAVEYLRQFGLPVVVEPHLPKTYVDGATIPTDRGPVIGLTLRHDRLDSFWFTLFHELAHVILHGDQNVGFFDDIESPAVDPREKEADAAAGEALIPEKYWKKSPASRLRSPQAAEHLAKELRIHPAIIAGRIRKQFDDYRVLSHMVGSGTVRRLFEEFQS